jgi:hypothetical protein
MTRLHKANLSRIAMRVRIYQESVLKLSNLHNMGRWDENHANSRHNLAREAFRDFGIIKSIPEADRGGRYIELEKDIMVVCEALNVLYHITVAEAVNYSGPFVEVDEEEPDEVEKPQELEKTKPELFH